MDYNFGGLATLALIGFLAILGAIVLGVYTFCDYFWIEDRYESAQIVTPEIVIKSETRNGKTHSDTTYVYTFK
jgi:hypothetical protein